MSRIIVLCISFVSFLTNNAFADVSYSVTSTSGKYNFVKQHGFDVIQPLSLRDGRCVYADNHGKPDLPQKTFRFIIGYGETVSSVEVNVLKETTLDGEFHILPVQKPQYPGDSVELFQKDKAIYESDNVYPETLVTIAGYSCYQGNTIVTVHVSPFRYYPIEKKLILIEHLSLSLRTKPGGKKGIKPSTKDPISLSEYYRSLASLVDNTQDINLYAWRPNSVSTHESYTTSVEKKAATPPFYNYVVISPSSFHSAFCPFVKWLKRKGISAGVVDIADIYSTYAEDGFGLDDNPGKIRGYLRDGFDEPSNAISWVLLGGTDTHVPARYGKRTGQTTWDFFTPADLYYGEIDEDWNSYPDSLNWFGDYFDHIDGNADIMVGRLVCENTTDIRHWIQKLLKYEQYPGNGDVGYLNKSYWIAADQMRDFPLEKGFQNSINIVNTYLTSPVTVYEQPSGNDLDPTSPSGADVINDMNGEFGLINWFCHGSPDHFAVRTDGYNISTCFDKYGVFSYDYLSHDNYIDESNNGLDCLTNKDYYSVVNSICCQVAAYDTIAHINGYGKSMPEVFLTAQHKGGAAFIGNTRSIPMGCGDDVHALFCEELFTNDNHRIGNAYSLSKATGNHDCWLSNNLFGDPFMPVWTGVPTTFSPTITITSSSVTVDAGETGCTIAASSNDFTFAEVNDNVQSCTFTTSTRPLFIVITKQNRLPYIALTGGTISSDQTWDEFTNITILDDITIANGATLTIAENTIVMVDPGEKIIINGTLTVNEGVSFVNIPGENVWYGIEINATGVLDVDGDITIDGALRGIHIKNINGLDNGTNVITMKHCTESGVYFSASAAVSYISCEDIDSSGSYNKAMNISLSSICPVIEHVSVSKYSHAVYMGGGGVLARYLDVANNLRSHSINQIGAYGYIDLEGPSQVGNNNIRRYSNSKAVYNYSNSTVEARNNFWGMSPPLSTIFYRPNLVNYDPWLTSAASAGAFAKIAPVVSDPDLIDIAQGLEFNGDLVNAVKYYSKALESENDPAKKHYILISMLRTIDKGNRDYDGIRSLLENEIAGAKDLYLPTIEFILTDILVREGMYREAAEEFTQKAEKYADTQVGVEMFCRAAELYGDYLNDAQTALSLANRAKEINPGQQNLSIAFEAAGVSYDPNEYKNIFAPEEVTDEPAEDPHQEPTEQETVTSITITPNPANPFTTIQYTLAKPGNVSLDIYSISGQKVATLVDGAMTSGTHSAVFDGSSMASGIYLYRFRTAEFAKSGKIALVK